MELTGPTTAVSADTLGAWVLKCNPRSTDPAELADRGADRWCVATNYRSRLMTAGQPVVLWVTGARPRSYERGFWAGGLLTGAAVGTPSAGLTVPLSLRFWPRPVTAAAVMSVPGLADIEVLRQPQMANPSFLTAAQWRHLQVLLPD